MSNRITSYDAKKVTIAAGYHNVTGFAEDSFVNIEQSGDGVTAVQGCDGEIARSIPVSTLYTVKITLLQNSKSNDYFEKMCKMDRQSGNGIFPITISDILGGQKFAASQGWVTKIAPFSRGKDQKTREWEIVCDGEFKN